MSESPQIKTLMVMGLDGIIVGSVSRGDAQRIIDSLHDRIEALETWKCIAEGTHFDKPEPDAPCCDWWADNVTDPIGMLITDKRSRTDVYQPNFCPKCGAPKGEKK